jgi:hypothetical protein
MKLIQYIESFLVDIQYTSVLSYIIQLIFYILHDLA